MQNPFIGTSCSSSCSPLPFSGNVGDEDDGFDVDSGMGLIGDSIFHLFLFRFIPLFNYRGEVLSGEN